MAKVRINGDTSGYIELASPAAAGSNTLTLPSSNGSANQLLKNSGTAGTLAWSTLTEDSSGNLNVDSGTLYVDASNNRVGIGTTSPASTLHVEGTGRFVAANSALFNGTTGTYSTWLYNGTAVGDIGTGNQVFSGGSNTDFGVTSRSSTSLVFGTNTTERARIDISGRLLIGTSSSPTVGDSQYGLLRVQGNTSSASGFGVLSIGRGQAAASITSGSELGHIHFTANDGSPYAVISGYSDGTSGSGDYPGRLVFSTTADGASSPTERMRITSAGRVGIGTTSPNELFEVRGTENQGIRLTSTATSGEGANLQWYSEQSGDNKITAEIESDGSGTGGNLFFSTRSTAGVLTERLFIANDGTVVIGDTTTTTTSGTGQKFYNTTPSIPNFLTVSDDNIPAGRIIEHYNANASYNGVRFYVRLDGGIGNFQANNVNLSDINSKKDIAPAAGTWDCLKEWAIVNFRYKDQPEDSDLNMGVIAQQVAESCPEVITVFQEATEDQPEKLGVKEQQMMWMAIKALQEAQRRIEQLETLNASFEARLAALEVKP